MRIVLALLFIIHGIAHLPGFVVPWRLAAPRGLSYRSTILGGSVDMGPIGIRVLGLLWLLAALGFVLTGVGAWRNATYWPTAARGTILFSLILCITGWPETRFGLVLDILLLCALAVGARASWLSLPTHEVGP